VTTSCSASKMEGLKDLGADEVLDYTAAPIHEQLRERSGTSKFHVIFETIGLPQIDLFSNSPAYLVSNGVFVSVGPHGSKVLESLLTTMRCSLQPAWLGGTPRKFKIVLVQPNQADLETVRDLVTNGKLKCPIDSIFSFDDTLRAFDRLRTGKANGKVVISIP